MTIYNKQNINSFMKTTKQLFYILLVLLSLQTISCKNNQNKTEETIIQTENTDKENSSLKTQNTRGSVSVEEDLSGKLQFISEEQFYQKVTETDNEKGIQFKGKTPVIVDFYADWCRPCHALNPVLEDLAAKYKGKLIIYKVNVDKSKNLATFFQIQSIPTLIFFKKNSQPSKIVGAPSKSDLEKAINDVLL